MNGIDEVCQELADQIAALEAELADLEDALASINELPPNQRGAARAALLRQIAATRNRIRILNQQLQACLHPIATSNLRISGIERTQATQYFLFNGQGSGYAPNNTVPLVAQKALMLRVYVNQSAVPSFPIPASLTGTVTYGGKPPVSPLNGPIVGRPANTIDRGNANHTLNFRIPAADCTGTVTFTALVFDPAHPGDPAYTSPPLSVTVHFDTVPQVRVHGVLI